MMSTMSLVNVQHFTSYIFFLVMRTLKIYSLSNFKYIYSIVNNSHHAVQYIPRTYLSYNWKFTPFGHLLNFPAPKPRKQFFYESNFQTLLSTNLYPSPYFSLFFSLLRLCFSRRASIRRFSSSSFLGSVFARGSDKKVKTKNHFSILLFQSPVHKL